MAHSPQLQGLIQAYRERPPTQDDIDRLRRMTPEGWDMMLDAAYVAAVAPRAIVRLVSTITGEHPRSATIAAVKAAIASGETLRSIGLRFNISRTTAMNMGNGSYEKQAKKPGRPKTAQGIRARELLAQGYSVEEVANETGLSRHHVKVLNS